jgi:hypothetical protein
MPASFVQMTEVHFDLLTLSLLPSRWVSGADNNFRYPPLRRRAKRRTLPEGARLEDRQTPPGDSPYLPPSIWSICLSSAFSLTTVGILCIKLIAIYIQYQLTRIRLCAINTLRSREVTYPETRDQILSTIIGGMS